MYLPVPYNGKNVIFSGFKECRRGRGVTQELLYCNGDKLGLIDFISVYSGSAMINVNANAETIAGLRVIPALPPARLEVIYLPAGRRLR
jgi:hypothetical protein